MNKQEVEQRIAELEAFIIKGEMCPYDYTKVISEYHALNIKLGNMTSKKKGKETYLSGYKFLK